MQDGAGSATASASAEDAAEVPSPVPVRVAASSLPAAQGRGRGKPISAWAVPLIHAAAMACGETRPERVQAKVWGARRSFTQLVGRVEGLCDWDTLVRRVVSSRAVAGVQSWPKTEYIDWRGQEQILRLVDGTLPPSLGCLAIWVAGGEPPGSSLMDWVVGGRQRPQDPLTPGQRGECQWCVTKDRGWGAAGSAGVGTSGGDAGGTSSSGGTAGGVEVAGEEGVAGGLMVGGAAGSTGDQRPAGRAAGAGRGLGRVARAWRPGSRG